MDGAKVAESVAAVDLIALAWWAAWFVFSWATVAVLWRRGLPIRLGVFIGLVAVTGLLAALYIPDSPVLRAIVGFIGASFLIGEIVVIYRDGARRDDETRQDRQLHDTRSERIITAFTEFQSTLSTAEEARSSILQSVLDTVTVMAGSERATLRQETLRLMNRLSRISADFHRTKLAIEQEPLAASGNSVTSAYAAALNSMSERLGRIASAEQASVEELYGVAFPEIIGIQDRYKKFGIEHEVLTRATGAKGLNFGNGRLGAIDLLLPALSEVANRLAKDG